jgi:ubiquinone/menaquinone biosynthesis C-methylase UbiE
MDWHARYTQQANWTLKLRKYIFQKIGLITSQRVLEVGCGTGAILSEINTHSPHGLDIQPASLMEARVNAPAASLTCGDALYLPYPNEIFEVTFCHFLLLWVSNPQRALNEMKRVTKQGGYVLALAEPDYSARVDEPFELAVLGEWQTEALQRQGADPSMGNRVAELFFQAGIELVETGAIQNQGTEAPTSDERKLEWAVLENDLAEFVPAREIQRLRNLDEAAWARGERKLHVPTYFAWGRV